MNAMRTTDIVLGDRAIGPGSAASEIPKGAADRAERAIRPGSAASDLCREGRAQLRLYDVEGYEKAVPLFRKALEEEPGRAEAHAGLAFAYALWGFRREIDGREPEGYYRMALQNAEAALKAAPESGEAHRAMAVALRRGAHADPVRRKEEVLLALDLEPGHPDNWYELWRASGSAAADPAIKRALELDPSHCAARIDLGVILCEEGRHREALTQFQLALRGNPRNSLALYNAAMVLNILGLPDNALSVLRKGLALQPGSRLLETGVGVIHGRQS